MSQGVQVFHSLSEALRAGFHICGRYDGGYLVRTRTSKGWVMAMVEVKLG